LPIYELNTVFEKDADIQQIRYKRAFGRVLTAKRDFVVMKGQVMQLEHAVKHEDKMVMNAEVGFKCYHYSVSESSGRVKIAV